MNRSIKEIDGRYYCFHCDGELIPQPGTFYYRGREFAGLVCEACNALYDNPKDSFMEYVKEIHDSNL